MSDSTHYPNSPNISGSAESSSSIATTDDNGSGRRHRIRIEPIEHGANQHAQELDEETATETDSDCVPKAGGSRGEQTVPDQRNTRKRISSNETAQIMAWADAYDKLPEHLRLHAKTVIRDRDEKRRKVDEERLKLQMEKLADNEESVEPSSDD